MQNLFVAVNLHALNVTPTPNPANDGLRPGLSADQVTPGLLGFVMTAFMVIAVVLLMVSMTRRIRRVRYRAQVSGGEHDGQPEPGEKDEVTVIQPDTSGTDLPRETQSQG